MTGLRVALVSPYDFAYPGGVGEHVCQLDRALRALGHETTVIAPSSDGPSPRRVANLVVAGRVVRVPANGSVARITLSLGLSAAIKRILNQSGFDVIHLHEPFIPLLPLLVLRHSHTANVGTFHAFSGNELGYRHGRFLLRRYFSRLDARIAVSETARSFVARHFPADYAVIPNGVDLERFRGSAPLADLVDGIPNILFVGRLDDRKGFRGLLQAFALLRRRGVVARLLVVGAYSPVQRRHYEEVVARSNIPDVVFVGYAAPDQLPRYYRSASVLCAPSLGGESFGVVLAEAMAAGTPIVASGIAGYRDVVADGDEGLLVPPGDVAALADALGRVVGDVELGRDLGRRGQIKAPRFAWSTVVNQVLASYYGAMTHIQENNEPRRSTRVAPVGLVDPAAPLGRRLLPARGGERVRPGQATGKTPGGGVRARPCLDWRHTERPDVDRVLSERRGGGGHRHRFAPARGSPAAGG
ncbi:MAG: glycosyltransferase family 4 protein, partial [Chloroflexota bacterium]